MTDIASISAIVATLAWLIARDRITEVLRDYLSDDLPAIVCPRCVSFWVAAVVVPLAWWLGDVSALHAIGGGALGTLVTVPLIAIDDYVDAHHLIATSLASNTEPGTESP